jgi:hypothetical protein
MADVFRRHGMTLAAPHLLSRTVWALAPRLGGCTAPAEPNLDGRAVNCPGKDALNTIQSSETARTGDLASGPRVGQQGGEQFVSRSGERVCDCDPSPRKPLLQILG